MPSQRDSNALEMVPRKMPSPTAYSGASTGDSFGLKMHTMASAKAPNSAIHDQPGSSTWLSGVTVVCDHPKAPPARTSRNSANVFANVPLAVIARPAVVGHPGPAGGPPGRVTVSLGPPEPKPALVAGGAGGAVVVPEEAPAGEAQPGSSSSRTCSKRFSFSAGLAIPCPSISARSLWRRVPAPRALAPQPLTRPRGDSV